MYKFINLDLLFVVALTSINSAGFKRYDRFRDSVKQAGIDTEADEYGDTQPLQYDKTYGYVSLSICLIWCMMG